MLLRTALLAQEETFSASELLGDNILAWLTLAIGGALVVGNGLALLRPREDVDDTTLERAPLVRSLIQIVIGAVAVIWALATLLTA